MLSVPHLIIVFLVALLVFGPEKLPELARTLSKAMAEFHRLTGDFQETVQREMRQLEREALEQGRAKPTGALAASAAAPASPDSSEPGLEPQAGIAGPEEELPGSAQSTLATAEEAYPDQELEQTNAGDTATTPFESFGYDDAQYVAETAERSGAEWPSPPSGEARPESREDISTAEVSQATASSQTVSDPSEETPPATAGAEKPVHDHHPTAA
ncbi:MAG TPA: twin-arginine translocase TatA/TatE family subunit [Patescibacteria group bacterium]|nr:twin-arginine translocase TatA/TatE family subunit [Patescibacteria group bacterium]